MALLYGETVTLQHLRLHDIMVISDYLSMPRLLYYVESTFMDNINNENWPGFYRISYMMSMGRLQEALLDKFQDCVTAGTFGYDSLNSDYFSELLEKINSKGRKRMDDLVMFKSIVDWVNDDYKVLETLPNADAIVLENKMALRDFVFQQKVQYRLKHYEKLVRNVDFSAIKTEDVKQVVFRDPYMMEHPHLMRDIRLQMKGHWIYLFGGASFPKNVMKYCPFRKRFKECSSPPRGMASSAIGRKGDVVYVAGGGENGWYVQRYNIRKDEWLDEVRMPESRDGCVGEIIGDKMYVTGGRCMEVKSITKFLEIGHKVLNTTAVFDISNGGCKVDKSIKIQPLKHGRMATCSLQKDDEIFIIGGINKIFQKLNTVEVINVKTGKVSSLPPMHKTRAGHSAVFFNDQLVVMGGSTDDGPGDDLEISSVEAFCFDTKKWSFMPSTNFPRDAGVATVFGSKIYLLGGDSPFTGRNIECYDPEVGRWTIHQERILPERICTRLVTTED